MKGEPKLGDKLMSDAVRVAARGLHNTSHVVCQKAGQRPVGCLLVASPSPSILSLAGSNPAALTIDIDGGVAVALTDDATLLDAEGTTSTRRYSHIWPSSLPLRLLFRSIRRLTRERGPLSDWTRTWRCRWQVRLADSPDVVRFESGDRSACVAWEKANLQGTL